MVGCNATTDPTEASQVCDHAVLTNGSISGHRYRSTGGNPLARSVAMADDGWRFGLKKCSVPS